MAVQDEEISKYKKDAENQKNKVFELEKTNKEQESNLGEQLEAANNEKDQLLEMCKNLKDERDKQKK